MTWGRVAILTCVLSAGAAPPAGAQLPPQTRPANPDPRRGQIDAAAADALQALRRDVLATSLSPDLSVRQFLYRTGGLEPLTRRLDNAEQRGGTRWRDDGSCEILLEVRGTDVADTLSAQASGRKDLGVTSAALDRAFQDLRGRTFSAVGVSMQTDQLARLRPDDPTGPWRFVADERRRDALMTAKANAVARLIESLRPIPLAEGGKTVDAALAVPGVTEELRQWVGTRPVTGVEFRDDLDVRLTLMAPADELWPTLQASLLRHGMGPSPQDAAGWEALRDRVLRDTAPATGRGSAAGGGPATGAAKAPVRLPRMPPDWVSQQSDADGAAAGSPRELLKTARLAESDALAKLRTRIDALPLATGLTVGEAARQDPRIEQAVARAVRRALVLKVDYDPPRGSAAVRVSLPLDHVWQELNAGR